jgi:hypothetical protein
MNKSFKPVKKMLKTANSAVSSITNVIKDKSSALFMKIVGSDPDFVKSQQTAGKVIWGGGIGDGDYKKSKSFMVSYKLLKTLEKKGCDRKLIAPLCNFRDRLESNVNNTKNAVKNDKTTAEVLNCLVGVWMWLVGLVASVGLRPNQNKQLVWTANRGNAKFAWEISDTKSTAGLEKFVRKRVEEFDKEILKKNLFEKLIGVSKANESVVVGLAVSAMIGITAIIAVISLYRFIQFAYFTFRQARLEFSEFIELQSEYLTAESGNADSKQIAGNLASIANKVNNIAKTIGEDYEGLEKKVDQKSGAFEKSAKKIQDEEQKVERETTSTANDTSASTGNDLLF